MLSIYLQNSGSDPLYHRRIGLSHIRIGEDPAAYSINNAVAIDNITDGGFFEASDVT